MKTINLKYLLVAFVIFSCSKPVEDQTFDAFVNEQFADLDVATLQSLETPYESIFSPKGGRLSGDVVSLADISSKLADIFPEADVLEAELSTERGIDIWEIKLKMPTDGIVKLDFAKEIGEIMKIKGKTGPFDYEIDPQGSFIPFSEAKQVALDAVGGEIKKWSLELEENNEWEYEFHTVGDKGRFEVEVKGFEATIISIKEKADDQDEDNDGVDEGDDENTDDAEQEDENTPAPDAVVNFAKEIFAGDVIQSEKRQEEDQQDASWKIYIENQSGAVVKFIITESLLEVIKVAGETGPFDYNIEINDNLWSLTAIFDKVFSEVDGAVTQWELSSETEMDEVYWKYEVEVTNATTRYEIELNAQTGEITKFEEDN